MKQKLLLIGWDAADWQIINPMLQQGLMPALATLLDGAAWGNLATLDPPISPMLWTSIATGKRPYKHGIHGFTELAPDGKTVRPVRSTTRTAKAIWNILNENQLKTNVVGWWPSHPAEAVNGCMVSNFFPFYSENNSADWPMMEDTIFPAELSNEFKNLRLHPEELTAEIMRNFFPEAENLSSENSPILQSATRILAQTASIHDAATYAMQNYPHDFMAVYYDGLDHFSHLGMKYHPPKLAGISDVDYKDYHYIVTAAYRFFDMMLDTLIRLATPDTNIVLVSDHGFESGKNRLTHLPEEPGAPALEHRPYGIFVGKGPAFKKGQIYGASLLDIAPTVLQIFNLPYAQDFDGQVLVQCLNTQYSSTINTYETAEFTNINTAESTGLDAVMLQQLAALGYINAPEKDANPLVQLAENEYYLARSFADGNLPERAVAIMQKLVNSFPEVSRYQNFYASILLRTGQLIPLQNWIDKAPKTHYRTYMVGLMLLQQQKPRAAADAFAQIPTVAGSMLHLQLAKTWFMAGNFGLATEAAAQCLVQDEENIGALNILGDIALAQDNSEKALGFYFKSLSVLYYQPAVHLQISNALLMQELAVEAMAALEVAYKLAPQNAEIKQQLLHLYKEYGAADERFTVLKKDAEEATIIVSGFARSGTSLMMQMLQSGGVQILTDGKREADSHNENGYLELEEVKNIAVNQSFMADAPGKAVKIVMPLLRLLQPTIPLTVIVIEREIEDILASQQKMIGKNMALPNLQLLAQMNLEKELMYSWLNRHAMVRYITLSFNDVLENPAKAAEKIANFLNLPLDTEKMARCVVANPKNNIGK